MESFDTLVTTDWLAAHLNDPEVRIVDIRGYVRKSDLGGDARGPIIWPRAASTTRPTFPAPSTWTGRAT